MPVLQYKFDSKNLQFRNKNRNKRQWKFVTVNIIKYIYKKFRFRYQNDLINARAYFSCADSLESMQSFSYQRKSALLR